MYKIIVDLTLIVLFLIIAKTSKLAVIRKNKISKEIIILSFIIILYALQGMPTFDFNAYYVKFYPASRNLCFARFLISWIWRVILIISGLGIIFRKEIFRKMIILTSFISMLTIGWKHPLAAVKRFIVLKINTGVLPFDWLPKIDTIAWAYVIIYSIIDLTVAFFLVYLFTRARIKEQFI